MFAKAHQCGQILDTIHAGTSSRRIASRWSSPSLTGSRSAPTIGATAIRPSTRLHTNPNFAIGPFVHELGHPLTRMSSSTVFATASLSGVSAGSYRSKAAAIASPNFGESFAPLLQMPLPMHVSTCPRKLLTA